ncbi:hypothetical protein AYL99_03375 [Fonsecaea erecta]|uniref:FAD-binding domain-containing protein n=1 Tax=Fonsecaea erecta TaxID=1367422 RepID=A0A178ZMX7_9EURO|nr:hypothetical protein AYL99_03375 [Fonsecaea erecta]OAP61174.1 hypothetical protein AYL99_03375 [Fonsecaea erecta]
MATQEQNEGFETTDVIICGCGPTGALLSGLLGRMCVKNVVLEKELEIVTDPRGIALDEDGIRLLQELGLYKQVHGEIGQHIGWTLFTSGKNGLMTKPFMKMNLSTTEGGTGHVAAICHKQPVMEKNIRMVANSCPSSQLRLGSTIVGIEEERDFVRAQYIDKNGTQRTIQGRFFVGADGKTGFTRKRYLESKGVSLQTLSGYEYQETWVAMNWHMNLPTPETHPDFPLWKLNYTPEQVYDKFFPPGFRFIGNPGRPSVCGSFGPRSERLWRFEFVVDKGEDPHEMATWERTSEIVLPYLTHPGADCGVKDSVQYPIDCIHVLRSRPFTFAARSCNKWAVGRVVLCGDAAHVMPPFGGQGIASGFRDASGIAWRLALACRPGFDGSYEDLFNGWFLERKQQLDLSLAATVANGSLTTARNPTKIFFRDWILWLMQLVPSLRHRLELGPRAGGMQRYRFSPGMAFLPELAGGRCLPQVYCCAVHPSTKALSAKIQFTDDVFLNGPRANALLRLLVVVDDMEQAEKVWSELKTLELDEASNNEIRKDSAFFLIHSRLLPTRPASTSSDIPRQNVYRVATADEFGASDLCKNRPYPTGYDMYRIKKDVGGRNDTLLRHARIHSQDSTVAGQGTKAAPKETPQTVNQDASPSRTSTSASRSRILEGRAATLYDTQSTPASHSSGNSSGFAPYGNVRDPGAGLDSTFPRVSTPQIISDNPVGAIQPLGESLQAPVIFNQSHIAASMPPAPAVVGADASISTQTNPFNFSGHLETHPFVDQLTDVHSGQWLLEDDFDFTIFEHMGFSNTLHEPHLMHHEDNFSSPAHQKSERSNIRPAVLDLRQIWYIQISGTANEPDPDSGTVTPRDIPTTSVDNIDETYRVRMAKKLRPVLRDEPLPSIDFMNLCIHLFFTRFNVALPLIHSPTFRPTHSNALLVLSICSAGCLSLGSEISAKTGSMLFERVNKAILVAPWERNLPRTSDQTWNVVKASMIGQTYALLSGDPAHRATAAAYHGSLIALARHHKLFNPAPSFHLPDDPSAEALDKAWRTWAKQEELRRMAVLLYIHDAEISALFHHEPVFRHNAGYIPTVSSSELFCAPSAATWASLLRVEQREMQFGTSNYGSETTSAFDIGQRGMGGESQSAAVLQRGLKYRNILNVYNSLSGISASICECRHLDLLSFNMVSKFESDLLTWYASTPKDFKMSCNPSLQTEAPFSLLPLWHYNFLALSTDLNLLEIASGKEGSEVSSLIRESVTSWIRSLDSKRCLLHALFLQNLIVSTHMGALVAIHTPRILFSAAICWYCYMLYLPGSSSASMPWASSFPDGMFEPLNSLPEIQLLREGKSMDSTNIYPVPHILDETLAALPKILAANIAEMKADTLCVIECILRRLGTTGISLRFADIIQVFISGEKDSLKADQQAV